MLRRSVDREGRARSSWAQPVRVHDPQIYSLSILLSGLYADIGFNPPDQTQALPFVAIVQAQPDPGDFVQSGPHGMWTGVDMRFKPHQLPAWRVLPLRDRLGLLPAILRGATELALARLQLDQVTPAKITEYNQRAARADRRLLEDQVNSSLGLIAFVIPRVAARLPWRAECLIQAIAAQRWLRSRGISSEITIGVDKTPEGEFRAHAWLKHGDHIVTGGDISGYSPLLTPDLEPS